MEAELKRLASEGRKAVNSPWAGGRLVIPWPRIWPPSAGKKQSHPSCLEDSQTAESLEAAQTNRASRNGHASTC